MNYEEDFVSYYDIFVDDDVVHYGTKRHSGRYPWGSGENPYQHSGDFLARVKQLRAENITFVENGKVLTGENAIAASLGLNSGVYRKILAVEQAEERMRTVSDVKKLKAEGLSNGEIAKRLGLKNESTVRGLLDEDAERRMMSAHNTADFIRKQIEEKGIIMVGTGVERELGNLSSEKLQQALYILEREGYPVYNSSVNQATNPDQKTNLQVICPKGTPYKDSYDYSKIHSITDYATNDDGETFHAYKYPNSVDSKRVQIKYAEDGGVDRDGVIELRRGVPDLSLGNANYAQVRILVDGTHYLKGMAVYSDDLPEGVDIRFNTNKSKGTPMLGPKDNTVLKPIKKDDPDNPFGAYIKPNGQSYYVNEKGEKVLSPINKMREEGDWADYSAKLPSQFLGKQNIKLINRQLNLAKADKQSEFDDIMSVSNPTLRKYLLDSFAKDCDSASYHLQAAALPRQKYHVLLPVPSLKDNEIYAPGYEDGEEVCLVRFPHGGIFEIPKLKVNNKNKEGAKLIGADSPDGVGINSKVAQQLSGADYDGDTALVIPTGKNGINISYSKPLEQLKGFDPHVEYAARPGMKVMTKAGTQKEMGVITNLIIDMTIEGAGEDEIARAVKHSMVVIDAEKHKLDYKRSEYENDIDGLKRKWQKKPDGSYGAAATLLSRAKSQQTVDKRQGSPTINPETGELIWKTADDLYYEVKKKDPVTGKKTIPTGKFKKRTQRSNKMLETSDARTLISEYNTPQEQAYADYANKMKSLANQARLEIVHTKDMKYDPVAKSTYQKEYDSLMAQLAKAKLNDPRERMAQVATAAKVQSLINDNPDLADDKKQLRKIRQRELTKARLHVGAKRVPITISDREWEAIQKGAISASKLNSILKYTDTDRLKDLSMPKERKQLRPWQINKMKTMAASNNYTLVEIAKALGVSSATVGKYLKDRDYERKESATDASIDDYYEG